MGWHNKYEFSADTDISMCIYKIQNINTGLIYIGKTKVTAGKRWSDHLSSAKRSKTHIGRSLHKYGKDAFSFEVIDIAEDEKSLNEKEKFYIYHFKSLSPNGYNLTTGGEGGSLSEETKSKLSNSHARLHGKERSSRKEFSIIKEEFPALYNEMVRLNRSTYQQGKTSPMKGKKHTAETLLKMKENADYSTPYIVQVTRNDGVVFPSIKAAAEASGTNKPNIVSQIKGLRWLCNGYQFKYGTHSPWEIAKKVNGNSVQVVRSDGAVFNSLKEAAVASNVQVGNITKVLTGKRATTGGFSFKYLEVTNG